MQSIALLVSFEASKFRELWRYLVSKEKLTTELNMGPVKSCRMKRVIIDDPLSSQT